VKQKEHPRARGLPDEGDERLRRLASYAHLNPHPVVEVDYAGAATYLNPAGREALDRLGLETAGGEAFLPADFVAIVAQEGCPPATACYREVEIRGRTFGAHCRVVPEYRVVVIYAADITERKRAATELLESQERYRRLIETANEGIIFGDESGRILYANRKMAEMLGYPPGELHGRPGTDFMPAGEREKVLKERARLEAGTPIDNEFCFRRKDGTLLWTIGSAAKITNPAGESVVNLAMHTDITKRRQAEQELRQEIEIRKATERGLKQLKNRFALLASAASQFLHSTEPKADIRRFSRKTMEYLGCDVYFTFLLDHPSGQLQPNGREGIPAATAAAIAGMGRVTTDGGQGGAVGPVIPASDPRAKLLKAEGIRACSCLPLLGKRTETIGALFFGSRTRESFTDEDLSLMHTVADLVATAMARHLAAERLRATAVNLARTNQDLAQFAYVASHDLQEPLRNISSFIELLEMRCAPQLGEKGLVYLHQVKIGAVRMRQLIEDLLEYGHAGLGREGGRPVPSRAALDAALADLATLIAESGAEITADELPVVEVDSAQLTAVLKNLLVNAIKYHRPSLAPRIHIGARRDGDAWLFSVRDNGIGIPVEYNKRIFGVFQRLHAREAYAGTGIGLAIVKRIVEAHGGRIWVESLVGEGSTFTFTLPALPSGAGQHREPVS
jgi:PAS domain S-box-containing protein